MPQLIQLLVVFALNFSVLAWRNDCFHSGLFRFLDNRIQIITPVSQKGLGFDAVNQGFSLFTIRCGTFCIKTLTGTPCASTARCILVLSPLFSLPCLDFRRELHFRERGL